MEAHVFCGPEFILRVPRESISTVLVESTNAVGSSGDGNHDNNRSSNASDPTTASASGGGSSSSSPEGGVSDATQTRKKGWTVRPEVLLEMQSELFSLCSPALQRSLNEKLQHMRGSNSGQQKRDDAGENIRGATGIGAIRAAPSAPSELLFIEAKATNTTTLEEAASISHTRKVVIAPQQSSISGSVSPSSTAAAAASTTDAEDTGSMLILVYITDSRVAGQVCLLALRSRCIALVHQCRLFPYFKATARAAPVVLSDVLAKREALRARHNLDADLWRDLQDKLTPEFIDNILQHSIARGNQQRGGRLLTAVEQHQQKVEAVLHYSAEQVQYVGVLDNAGGPSPFLLAMGLTLHMQLTADDLLTHFVRHPRRVVRAIALFLARYLLAPEELGPYFLHAIKDGVMVSCTEDARVTSTMQELSTNLLRNDEVGEAWLPIYHPFWLETVVETCITRMNAHWTRREEARQQRRVEAVAGGVDSDGLPHSSNMDGKDGAMHSDEDGGEGDEFALGKATARRQGGAVRGLDALKGEGRGVAALGFRSVQAIAQFAKEQARTLKPLRMATLLARTRHASLHDLQDEDEGAEEHVGSGDEDVDDIDEGEEDDFLINVNVAGAPSLPGTRLERGRRGRDGAGGANIGGDAGAPPVKRSRRIGEVLDAHALALEQGQKVALSLLGRTQPFNKHDARYMEF